MHYLKPLYCSLLLVALFLFGSQSIHAQKKITRTIKAATVNDPRGENPNIKTDPPTADSEELSPRGQDCQVKFSNYTGYYVNVYIDGYYRGQLSPWGGGTVMVASGYTSIYCITAGKTLEWREAGDCKNKYNFKLYP